MPIKSLALQDDWPQNCDSSETGSSIVKLPNHTSYSLRAFRMQMVDSRRHAALDKLAKYPESSGRLDELLLFSPGFLESTINRMELAACIHAFEWVAEQGNSIDVQRVQIFTDSLYVFENHKRATTWRKQKWRNRDGRPTY